MRKTKFEDNKKENEVWGNKKTKLKWYEKNKYEENDVENFS